MALTTIPATIGNVSKSIIVAADASGDVAAGHVLVNSAGTETGTSAAPIYASTVLTAGAAVIGGVTQSGAWNVGLATGTNTIGSVNVLGGNTAAVKTDGSAVTQPVSAAALPLPAGAATAAKQPLPGVAGTASADVLTVQGIASGVPMSVSGTFWQATQPVSAAALPLPAGAATAANQPVINADGGAQTHVMNFPATQPVSGSVSVSNLPATQPVSAAALPLPAGAATAAKQPLPGAAGTASADVLTVQGIASMTALKVDGSASTQPVSAAALPLPAGAATAAKQPAIGTAGTASADVLSIQGVSGGTALPVSGTFWQATQPVSAAALPLPAGAATAANQPVINADGGAQTHVMNFPATQAISAAALPLPAGAGTAANQSSILSAIQAASLVPAAPIFVQSAAPAGNLVIKASAGSLHSCYVTAGTTAGYLMLFDAAAAPADGAVTPKHAIYCAANATTGIDTKTGLAEPFASGIVAVFSSTGPFSKTESATAFIKGVGV